jgi:antitoxin HicB
LLTVVKREMKLSVVIRPEREGGYSVSVPGMPGCHAQGEAIDEALANIREAAELWIEVQSDRAAREAADETPAHEIQEIEL